MLKTLLLPRIAQRLIDGIAAALVLAMILVLAMVSPLSAALARDVHTPPPAATIALNDSATAAQLASHLPMVLTFENRMGTAELAPVPVPLSVEGTASATDYREGDIAYLASEQTIVVFLTDGSGVPDDAIVLLGRVTSSLEDIAACQWACPIRLVPALDG